jgi:cell wall assembly regulator SMI1
MPTEKQIDDFLKAAAADAVPRLKALLQAGVPVDARDLLQKTALWYAAKAGAEAAFDYLLSQGADPAVRHPEHGWTPLQDAAGGATPAHERICQKLLASALGKDKSAVQGAMLAACCSGSAAIIQALIAAGADVNQKERVGGSYLLSAIKDNALRDQVVPILLAAGANLAATRPRSSYDSAADKKLVGKTAHEIARVLGYKVVAGLLAKAGAPKVVKRPPRPKPAATVGEAWDRIEAWLKANASGWKPLRKPATEAQVAWLEKAIDHQVPADLRQSLLRHNGSEEGLFPFGPDPLDCYGLYSATDIAGAWEMQAELLDDGDFDPNKRKAQAGIRAQHWNTGWLPIADNGAGDHFCVDLAPAKGGKVGQVIHVGHEGPKRTRLGTSVADWLGRFAADLEAGAYRYEEDENGLVHA